TGRERDDLIVDAGTTDIALNQAGMPLVVLDHDDGHGHGRRHAAALRLMVHLIGRVIVNVLPLSSSEATDMVPPRRRTRVRTCASPMPCPGRSWIPARRNRSKMRW